MRGATCSCAYVRCCFHRCKGRSSAVLLCHAHKYGGTGRRFHPYIAWYSCDRYRGGKQRYAYQRDPAVQQLGYSTDNGGGCTPHSSDIFWGRGGVRGGVRYGAGVSDFGRGCPLLRRVLCDVEPGCPISGRGVSDVRRGAPVCLVEHTRSPLSKMIPWRLHCCMFSLFVAVSVLVAVAAGACSVLLLPDRA